MPPSFPDLHNRDHQAELNAAQHNAHEVRVKIDGEKHLVPIHEVDPTKVELNCEEGRCFLVPDDGNPHNDIVPGVNSHGHESSSKSQIKPPETPTLPIDGDHWYDDHLDSQPQEPKLAAGPSPYDFPDQPKFTGFGDEYEANK